jgi:hypothetical protein
MPTYAKCSLRCRVIHPRRLRRTFDGAASGVDNSSVFIYKKEQVTKLLRNQNRESGFRELYSRFRGQNSVFWVAKRGVLVHGRGTQFPILGWQMRNEFKLRLVFWLRNEECLSTPRIQAYPLLMRLRSQNVPGSAQS